IAGFDQPWRMRRELDAADPRAVRAPFVDDGERRSLGADARVAQAYARIRQPNVGAVAPAYDDARAVERKGRRLAPARRADDHRDSHRSTTREAPRGLPKPLGRALHPGDDVVRD